MAQKELKSEIIQITPIHFLSLKIIKHPYLLMNEKINT